MVLCNDKKVFVKPAHKRLDPYLRVNLKVCRSWYLKKMLATFLLFITSQILFKNHIRIYMFFRIKLYYVC